MSCKIFTNPAIEKSCFEVKRFPSQTFPEFFGSQRQEYRGMRETAARKISVDSRARRKNDSLLLNLTKLNPNHHNHKRQLAHILTNDEGALLQCNPNSGIYIVPSHPESLYIREAAALIRGS